MYRLRDILLYLLLAWSGSLACVIQANPYTLVAKIFFCVEYRFIEILDQCI